MKVRLEKFRKLKRIPYSDEFSPSEFRTLQSGLKPETEHDRWIAVFDRNNLNFHRRKTGQGVYQIRFKKRSDGSAIVKWAKASKEVIVINAHYEAAMLDFLIANVILGHEVPFPRHKKIDQQSDGEFQKLVFGTSGPEVIVTTKSVKGQFK